MIPATPVILFKTPSSSSSSSSLSSSSASNDPYTQALSSTNYQPTHIPVLEERYDTAELASIIQRGGDEWEGVIITSRRGAEGWIQAVNHHLKSTSTSSSTSKDKGKGKEIAWSELPLWTVGTASIDHLNESHLPSRYLFKLPNRYKDNKEEPPKSAIHLTPHILNAPPRSAQGREYRPYLYVRGDKSTDILQDDLRKNGRTVRETMVYSTTPREDIRRNIQKFENAASGKGKTKGWLAFFSPSGAEVILNILSDMDPDPDEVIDKKDNETDGRRINAFWKGWKIFVIGETTRRCLEGKGIRVHAVAQRPTPEGLLKAIKEVDQRTF
ncbi:uncharacterized protein IL334_000531 [Kwoniella shivajii]|uniref:Tetrapyrrole biosynthesis uroporphyrinogen III synthase domain-containing protein n=1 Tax=Kwoniella shivajii TaxID=564305 RepID=A0ABZ1CPE0_9TREE|nr:hypothetical protein IL334_000531 [Kwoniella shivajii]